MRWPPKKHGEAFIAHDEASKLQTQSYRIHWQPLISEGQAPGDTADSIASRATRNPGQQQTPHEPNPGGILLCQHPAGTIQRGFCSTLPPNLPMQLTTGATATSAHDLRNTSRHFGDCTTLGTRKRHVFFALLVKFSLIGPQSCMVAFCVSVCRFQCEGERGFWHKHPWHASSWTHDWKELQYAESPHASEVKPRTDALRHMRSNAAWDALA